MDSNTETKEKSPMPLFELTLTGFQFPRKLPNDKANFRFVVDLRFTDGNGRFTTEHAVMPSLDTFWECATDKEDKPNYVRGLDAGNYGQFNVKTEDNNCEQCIDEWDQLILLVKGKSLHSIQFKVFDVDRKDAWDKVQSVLGGIVQAFFGRIKGIIPGNLPLSLSESMGGAADDVQSFLLKKLAGGDKVLFRGSHKFKDLELKEHGAPQPLTVNGLGTAGRGNTGNYRIHFNVFRRPQ